MSVKICISYIIFTIKLEVWRISHCLGLGYETIVYALRLTMLLLSFYKTCQNVQTAWIYTHVDICYELAYQIKSSLLLYGINAVYNSR